MGLERCGWCNAPVMAPGLCKRDRETLRDLVDRCDGLDADLAHAVAKQGRHGEREVVRGSKETPLPISPEAVEARDQLRDALRAALRAVLGVEWGNPRLTVEGARTAVLAHWGRIAYSWAGPVLLGDLHPAVRRAVRAVDTPRGGLMLSVPCPHCGQKPLKPVGGMLECGACKERSTVGEVRRAA